MPGDDEDTLIRLLPHRTVRTSRLEPRRRVADEVGVVAEVVVVEDAHLEAANPPSAGITAPEM